MFVCRRPRAMFHHRWLVNFACCQRLHVGMWYSQKKKWTRDEISSLLAWKYETDVICGPRVDFKKADNTVSRAKRKALPDVTADHHKVNDSQVIILFTANELQDGETHMADMPCSVTRRISSQTVLEDPVEKPVSLPVTDSIKSQKNILKVTENAQTKIGNSSKHSSEDTVSKSVKRDRTCGYTWVDSPSQSEKSGSRHNTIASVIQTANINSESVVQKREHHHVSSTVNASSGTGKEKSVENSSATELQTDEDKTQNNSSSENILSFPLFAGPESSTELTNLRARFPGISTILKATMPPESRLALARWEQRMIAELGEDGFKEYQTAMFLNGSNLHATIHQYLSGKPEAEMALLAANHGHWQSIEPVLADITDVVCLEKFIRHEHLQYCGILDCVAEYRGDKYVIDWKTSKRRKSSLRDTFDNPLQLVAYLGAYNMQPSTSLQVDRCLLVIGYEDGSAADVHVMDKWDCLQYWSNWLQRLQLYRAGTPSSL